MTPNSNFISTVYTKAISYSAIQWWQETIATMGIFGIQLSFCQHKKWLEQDCIDSINRLLAVMYNVLTSKQYIHDKETNTLLSSVIDFRP